jgi:hypothetical protein
MIVWELLFWGTLVKIYSESRVWKFQNLVQSKYIAASRHVLNSSSCWQSNFCLSSPRFVRCTINFYYYWYHYFMFSRKRKKRGARRVKIIIFSEIMHHYVMVAGSPESRIYFYDALSPRTKRRILKISHYPKWTPKQNDVLEKMAQQQQQRRL